jgi:glycosyltransferase involved in cell wall biosynthesis
MNIGIDARYISDRRTGLGRYAYELCRNLDVLLPQARFFLYSSRPIEMPLWSGRWTKRIDYGIPRLFARQLNLWLKARCHYLCKDDHLDIFWATATLLPHLPRSVKTISTVHDLCFDAVPQSMQANSLLMQKLFFKRDVLKADKLVAVSLGTAKRLYEYCGRNVPLVMPPSASEQFRVYPQEEVEKTRMLYQLDFPYILSVATWEPRKNIALLMETFIAMKDEGLLAGYKLVLVGQKGWRYRRISSIFDKHLKDIVYLGYVEDKYLAHIYQGAGLFVFPSIYEGFGLPVLEARRAGTAVVASDTPELREAGGSSTYYVFPDRQGIRKGIIFALSGGLRKDPCGDDGYSWQTGAQALAQLFSEMVSM